MSIPNDQLRVTVITKNHGGQQAGPSELGVTVEHIPTGLSATCKSERSQLKNRNIAISMIEWGLAEMKIDCPFPALNR